MYAARVEAEAGQAGANDLGQAIGNCRIQPYLGHNYTLRGREETCDTLEPVASGWLRLAQAGSMLHAFKSHIRGRLTRVFAVVSILRSSSRITFCSYSLRFLLLFLLFFFFFTTAVLYCVPFSALYCSFTKYFSLSIFVQKEHPRGQGPAATPTPANRDERHILTIPARQRSSFNAPCPATLLSQRTVALCSSSTNALSESGRRLFQRRLPFSKLAIPATRTPHIHSYHSSFRFRSTTKAHFPNIQHKTPT